MTRFIASLPAWCVFCLIVTPLFFGAALPPPFDMAIGCGVYLLWLYSLGVETYRQLSPANRIPFNRFVIAFFYFVGYAFVASVYFSEMMPYAAPFHILAMFGIFYSFYYVAKSLRTIELDRIAKFEDYFAIFFGLWFFPLGVWFIQRKMRRVSAIQ